MSRRGIAQASRRGRRLLWIVLDTFVGTLVRR